MEHKHKVATNALGVALRERRRELRVTLSETAQAADINKSTLSRLEAGSRDTPDPEILARLAAVLQMPAADLFAEAGYSTPQDIPTLRPYLRVKYGPLPEEAIQDIETHLRAVAARYGHVSDDGPRDGEDERPE